LNIESADVRLTLYPSSHWEVVHYFARMSIRPIAYNEKALRQHSSPPESATCSQSRHASLVALRFRKSSVIMLKLFKSATEVNAKPLTAVAVMFVQ
jgi:hypothetical protein